MPVVWRSSRLPLFGSAQLAIDTTLISTLHCDGSARLWTADTDGAASVAASRRKERTYPELVGPRGRARLVVLAGEVGGRWCPETRAFLSQFARAKARHEPRILRQGAAGLEIAVASDLVMRSRESIREVVAGIVGSGGL